jgi:beta-mannosidase
MNIDSSALKNHQKHPVGFQTIQSYLEKEYKQPKDFESYIYISQLLQAYGIKTAIEAHRRAKPYCMGTLYWQLNDCWPVVSWSGIDYYGRWKALQYFVQNAYKDILISEVETSDSLKVFIVNDRLKKLEGLLTLELHDFDGNSLWSQQKVVSVSANASGVYFSLNKAALLKNYTKNNLVFSARFVDNKINYYESLHYFVPPKEMQLSKPNIDISIKKEKDYFLIHLKTNILAKNIHLSIDGSDAEFNNNYFDLMPGEDEIIQCKTLVSLEELKTKLKIESLYDSYTK